MYFSLLGNNSTAVEALKMEIKGFHRWFNCVKESTIKCLEKCQIAVRIVVYMLTAILSVDEHKKFLEEKHKVLCECNDHWQLFGKLNLYWNYLACDLLDELIEELTVKNKSFESIAREMAAYKEDLQSFRKRTTLELFCLAVPNKLPNPPPDFKIMVTKHNWPNTITLEAVEEFRKCFFRPFNLPKCAIMVHGIIIGSFEVTWFVFMPDTVIEMLKMTTGKISVFRQYNVNEVVIDGECVYKTSVQTQVSFKN